MADNRREFSIVIIPDTQMLAAEHPSIYPVKAQWIADNAKDLNVQMILHLGDVVNDGADDEGQFRIAAKAFEKFDQAGIPFLVTPGNHDYDNQLKTDRSLTMFNRYFGTHRYENSPWFKGSYEKGKIENSYAALDIEGEPYLFLTLEFGARDEVLAWADGILEAHSSHKAIIITHAYMYQHGERTKPGDNHNPKLYKGAAGANDGEDMWQKSFRKHGNLIAVFSGHHDRELVSYRTDFGDRGNPVFQSFQNWQCTDNGGEGRIRILKMKPSEFPTFSLEVYNPHTGSYETNPGYKVEVPLKREEATLNIRHPL